MEEKNETPVVFDPAMEQQLTKRNAQYVFDLRKALKATSVAPETQTTEIERVITTLVEVQKTGRTARQEFGTVNEFIANIGKTPKKPREIVMWKMVLDNSLMLLMFLAILAAVFGFMSTKTTASGVSAYGIITMPVAAIAGGFAFYIIYRYVNQYDQPGGDRSKRPGFWKATSITGAAFIGWFVLISFVSVIPSSINLTLPPVVCLAIAVVTFFVRRYLKQRYNLQGSIMVR